MSDLKPCPFCGSPATQTEDDYVIVYCSDDDCPAHEMLACSAEQWNQRVPETSRTEPWDGEGAYKQPEPPRT